MAKTKHPRGIRNHNPGNIEFNPKTKWRGQIGSDGRFIIFSAPEYGIRTIIKVLQTYQRRHGLKSIRAMLTRWAPPQENHTNSYIAYVAKSLGVAPDDAVDLKDTKVAEALVRAIVAQENGYAYRNYYSPEIISKGLALAGIGVNHTASTKAAEEPAKSEKPSKIKYPRTTATAAASTATAAGAGLAIEQINSSLDGLQQLGASGAMLMSRLADAKLWLWLVIVAALAVGIYVAWSKYREVRK